MSERPESAVNHEHPSSIAERFVDGFVHPGLEHDAERLARGYQALEAELARLEAERRIGATPHRCLNPDCGTIAYGTHYLACPGCGGRSGP